MSARMVVGCELCGSKSLEPVLDLGSSPPTCNMPRVRRSEVHYPLVMLRCPDCGLAMLSTRVDPRELFPPDYPYQSANSRELQVNFADLAEEIDPAPHDLLVDIGANDGTLLSKFSCKTVGVEPTDQANKIRTADEVYHAPFTEALARTIIRHHGPASYVTATNVLAHVENINDTMRGINVLLGSGGVLYAENHDLASVVHGQWDTVYHEHLRFFDSNSFAELLNEHGLAEVTTRKIPTHGGSIRTVASRGPAMASIPQYRYDFATLRRRVFETRAGLRRLVGPLVGIGATARATTVINYCGFDVEDIDYVAEVAGSDKIGRLIPGTRVPVVDEARLLEDQTDAILFSWHLADTIAPALRKRGYKGRLYAPLPTLRELP